LTHQRVNKHPLLPFKHRPISETLLVFIAVVFNLGF